MTSSIRTFVTIALASLLCARVGVAQAPSAAPEKSGTSEKPAFKQEELDQLVAPVALYPDALISHVLPASTAPVDVVQAARYLRQHGGTIDKTPDNNWNVSVKVLMKFPDVLYKMDADLDWTTALGQAVSAQLDELMKAIQRVRHLAQAAGNLESNVKQTVVVESDVIRVVPSTSVIYVPTYEPTQVVVVQDKTNDAAIAAVSFAAGVAVGAALADDDCDWHGYGIYHGAYYHGHVGWNDHWRRAAQLPWNPRGVADPRGLYDPRGVFDPRGRYDPRGAFDPRGAGGVGRAGVGGQAGLGGGLAGQAGIGRGVAGPAGVAGGAGIDRAGAGGQAGLGGGAAGQAGVGGGAAGVGRAGAGGQAGVGGGAAGQAGVGGGAAGAGRAGAGGQAGAGGGAAGQAGAGRGSAFASPSGGASRTSAASARGNKSLSGGGSRSRGR